MVNHPNRSKRAVGSKYGAVKTPPLPDQIKVMRLQYELTQEQAASLIYGTGRTWQDWECGKRKMHPGLFELFELKLAQPELFATNDEFEQAAKDNK